MGRHKAKSTVQPLLLSVPDVATLLGVCRATVHNLMYYEKLPYIEVRGARRIHPDSLNEWMKRKTVN